MTVSLFESRAPRRDPGLHLAGETSQPPGRHLRLVAQPEGLLQIHTAPFRGSFAGVFSQALRTAGLGSRVLIAQLLRGGVNQGPEHGLWLCGRLQWLRPAIPLCLDRSLSQLEVELPQEAPAVAEAVAEVWQHSSEQMRSGQLDLLVLDELGLAVELGYLAAEAVIDCLEQRPPHLDVILTGPAMPPALMAMADQVTQLRRGL